MVRRVFQHPARLAVVQAARMEESQVQAASPRRRARRVALQALYEVDATGHPVDKSLNWVLEDTKLSDINVVFARRLAHQVLEHLPEIDDEIARYAPAWPVQQLSVVDRNVLRMAICEMRFEQDAPVRVIINEAVELARVFGSDGSQRFVNGVLGAIARASDQEPPTEDPNPTTA